MTQTTIILLIIFVIGVIVAVHNTWKCHVRFKKAKQDAESFIMNADRNNAWHGVKASDLVYKVRRYCTGRKRHRDLDGLMMLWRSKFAQHFNQ